MQKIERFNVIGISTRTTNENGHAVADIPALWTKFINEGIFEKIPDKLDNAVYCIYSDYEKDHTKPYTVMLGCKVENLNDIPDGMGCKTLEEALYEKFSAKGNLMQGAVFNEWTKIWNSDLQRTFTADFEVYDEKSKNLEDSEVEIFVAVK